ncbi:MAG TPA: hypothetical protein VFZ69_15825 [Longimicrobiales bacterium]
MAASKVLIGQERTATRDTTHAAWRALAWFGLVLTFVGLVDVILVFYPARMGDPSWEFGVFDAAVSSIPLLVVGVAALLGGALARSRTGQVRAIAALAVVLALGILGGYIVYLTNVPLALRLAPEEVKPGIYKSIVRTTVMSAAFGIGFMVAAVAAVRSTRSSRR